MNERPGPRIRTDLVEVYIFRRSPAGPEFLQLKRAASPQAGAWHPVMGHVDVAETAACAARRECAEETGLVESGDAVLGFWQLQQVHPFFIAEHDAVYLSPRFALEVNTDWTPVLNSEHTDYRWIPAVSVEKEFKWPGQRLACREAIHEIVIADRYDRLGAAT